MTKRRGRSLGHVYKRGNTWWIQFYYRGQRHRESAGSSRKSDAVKLLNRRLGEIGSGRLVGPDAERVTFDDLAQNLKDDYLLNNQNVARARTSLNRLREFFGYHHALDITTDTIKAYIRERQNAEDADSTIQSDLAALKRMFTLAIQAGRLAHRPHIPSMTVDNVRTHFVSETEFQTVHARLPDDIQPIVLFLYLTGWRVGEARQLEWRDVEFDAGMIRLRPGTTKNKEARTFPFAALPELEALLTEQRTYTDTVERKSGRIVRHVFHRNGKPIRCFRGAWKAACKDAGLPHLWVHDLRRSAVRRLIRSGIPQAVAMKITGHKTANVFRRYGIVTESDLIEAIEKLAEFRSTESTGQAKVVPFGHNSATIWSQARTGTADVR